MRFKVGIDRDLERLNTTRSRMSDRKVELSAMEPRRAIFQIDKTQFSVEIKLHITDKILKPLYSQLGAMVEGG